MLICEIYQSIGGLVIGNGLFKGISGEEQHMFYSIFVTNLIFREFVILWNLECSRGIMAFKSKLFQRTILVTKGKTITIE